MDILEEIVAHKRREVERWKRLTPPGVLYAAVERMADEPVPSMRRALTHALMGIIAEFKRRSPSKGWINRDASPDVVPLSYQRNGAAALSILTDEMYFGGADVYVTRARQSGVTIPILYKNFIIDEYQLFQARRCGASAVLLIAADLTVEHCRVLLHTAREIGLEALVEIHSESELRYAELEPDIIGVNNRNLQTFHTDVRNSLRLAPLLPQQGCTVSESGIHNIATLRVLRQAGYNGCLIGEQFMKSADPGEALRLFCDED